MKVILLSGWSGSGKDTTGIILERIANCSLLAFADILKEIVAKEYGYPLCWAYSQQGKMRKVTSNKTIRDLLVQRGQEIRGEQGSGYFAKLVAEKIKNLMSVKEPCSNIVITDWRLPIEMETLKEELNLPILKVRINRLDQSKSPVKDSETESQLDNWKFDCILYNKGTPVQELEKEVVKKLVPLL
jgi:hypothetical protein